ncbi:MAG: flagellar hook-length control protein FliK [Sulfuricurvum sp.]|uniref:flagellar hook-length control protein FliK n=2 Tax=Sulfuricurvum sp. TaxID=2025608 RepID=UPI003563C9AE
MIVQSNDTKASTSLIDLLGGNGKSSSSKSNDLFAKLLSSLSTQTKGEKVISSLTGETTKTVKTNDFHAVIDPKKTIIQSSGSTSSSAKELQSLLLGDEKASTLFSSDITSNLSNDQIRPLIHQAKEYLKNQITTKSPEYLNDPESLPKTLGGLVKLAEKMGLNPQSITLSTIMESDSADTTAAALPSQLLTKPLLDTKILSQLSTLPEDTASAEAIVQLLNKTKNKGQKETKSPSESTPAERASDKTDKTDSQPLKTLLQGLNKPDQEASTSSLKSTSKQQESQPLDTVPLKSETTNNISSTETKGHQGKVSTPLTTSATDINDLKTLLQGDTESKESKNDTTAINSKTDTENAKIMQPLEADSLEVKGKEAQQSMRHFASDLKEAVQEYKPPFTRLTMKLNPEKLGEVEVTLVQRGNNVHVNIQSSNATSVAFLAHNATELKAQLAHQGITNATMNFMSGGEGQAQNQGQQNQQQNRFKSYQSFEELELSEEQLSALEIVIPNYA